MVLRIASLMLILGSLLALTQVESAQISFVEVRYTINNKEKVKDFACLEATPGTLTTLQGESFFRTLRTKLKRLRKKRKADPTAKNRRRHKRIRIQFKAAQNACIQRMDQTAPTPTSTPTPSPTSAEESYFDDNGDVTLLGRQQFQIPSQYPANIQQGRIVWESYCTGCHEERREATFRELRLAISQEPMLYTENLLPDQDLAQIMAYLGRFRSPTNP